MSNQKKRNFQIEAFKHRVVVDPKYADKTWKVLEHAIHEIYNHNASGLSLKSFIEMPTIWCFTNLGRSFTRGWLRL
ncbi:Cullin-3 [Prunus yedoensis var. nudiflora]|uniref:Cullin-3 n=1 Tax=Prunus yedoensis var. nudiflora TaxID=2094558 RepID=A0A314USV5_PRUYE|nr:Cullin-3 [Prunus yedoensis var. nudiflora]